MSLLDAGQTDGQAAAGPPEIRVGVSCAAEPKPLCPSLAAARPCAFPVPKSSGKRSEFSLFFFPWPLTSPGSQSPTFRLVPPFWSKCKAGPCLRLGTAFLGRFVVPPASQTPQPGRAVQELNAGTGTVSVGLALDLPPGSGELLPPPPSGTGLRSGAVCRPDASAREAFGTERRAPQRSSARWERAAGAGPSRHLEARGGIARSLRSARLRGAGGAVARPRCVCRAACAACAPATAPADPTCVCVCVRAAPALSPGLSL